MWVASLRPNQMCADSLVPPISPHRYGAIPRLSLSVRSKSFERSGSLGNVPSLSATNFKIQTDAALTFPSDKVSIPPESGVRSWRGRRINSIHSISAPHSHSIFQRIINILFPRPNSTPRPLFHSPASFFSCTAYSVRPSRRPQSSSTARLW